jgi:hypothetical protein
MNENARSFPVINGSGMWNAMPPIHLLSGLIRNTVMHEVIYV